MQTIYLVLILFLFTLAIIDLWVGVSNDAVNFLNSAIGAKVARFKTIIIIAALGVFIGAAISNGMMDIARHGIFQPEHFSMEQIMCIFLAVMITDVLLLDLFNSLGMPTSTTVSLVFELLGATFAIACIKVAGSTDAALAFSDLLNTDKALQVIVGIFASVAIAFVAGTFVQWLTRLLFTFNYTPRLKWFIGLFGGVGITAILYFVVIKVLGKSHVLPEVARDFIADNTGLLITGAFIVCTIVMQILHFCRVNVFKIIVLFGTFALAMAFASNDLVNFVGVPLAALSSYTDFAANSGGVAASDYMMGALRESARTPWYFLVVSGLIMVVALIRSSKAKNVIQTSLSLSRQAEGEDMFGGNKMAKSLVRSARKIDAFIGKVLPKPAREWIDSRFNTQEVILAEGASFDLVRASVNLILSGMLIIMGTSLQLPLSTTYVTFIVAMGTSLADHAWSRESSVYRITGVLSVIGGWFMTAFIAFLGASIVALICYAGGFVAIGILIVLVIFLLHRGLYKKNEPAEEDVALEESYQNMLKAQTDDEKWVAMKNLHQLCAAYILDKTHKYYTRICEQIIQEDFSGLSISVKRLRDIQRWKQKHRAREVMGLRSIHATAALEKSTWFHLGNASGEQFVFGLKRLADPAFEHLESAYTPLSDAQKKEMGAVAERVSAFFAQAMEVYSLSEKEVDAFRAEIEEYKQYLSTLRKEHLQHITTNDCEVPMQTAWLYMNILQESQQLLSELRHFLRAYNHFQE